MPSVPVVTPVRTTRKQQFKELIRGRIANPTLRANHRRISADNKVLLFSALKQHYFSDPFYYSEDPDTYLATPEGAHDMAEHIANRLEEFRSLVIPWLNSFLPLPGQE